MYSKNPVVNLGSLTGVAPFSFIGKDGKPDGMVMDYIGILNRNTGIDFRVGLAKPWTDMMPLIREKNIDGIACAGKTSEREEELVFTDSYFITPWVIVTRNDFHGFEMKLTDLAGKKVAVLKSSPAEKILRHYPNIIIVTMTTVEQILEAVSMGEADATCNALASASYYISRKGITNLKVAGVIEEQLKLGLGIRKDLPELVTILNKAIASITPEEHQAIEKKWIALRYEKGVDWHIVRWWIFLIASVFFSIIILTLMWNRRLAAEIEKRRQTEEELRRSESFSRSLIENIPQRIFLKDKNSVYLSCNRNFALDLGYQPEQVIGKDDFAFFPKEMADIFRADDREVISARRPKDIEEKYISASEERWAHTIKVPYYNEQGDVVGLIGIYEDITERKRAEEERRNQFESFFRKHNAIFLFMNGETGQITDANDSALHFYGYSIEQMKSMKIGDINQLSPDELDSEKQRALEEERKYFVVPHRLANGEIRIVEVHTTPVVLMNMTYLFSVIHDITLRKQAEDALHESEARLKEAQRIAQIGNWELNIVTNTLRWSDEIFRIFEIDKKYFSASYEAFLSAIHPEDRDAVKAAYTQSLETRKPYIINYRLLMSDGRIKYVREQCETYYNIEGKALYSIGTVQDITERKLAEEERQKLEEQLRQSQKMEAIGQLAGGVAHDFNNLLQIIIGYGDMLMGQLPDGELPHKNMEQIMKAAQRAATLVRQLLLFSRRGAMQQKYLDLNQLISELMKMIMRVIGEHISLEIQPGYDLRTVYADPGQIEQVLMNLCINARDAMPDGGRIIIETKNISPDTEYCRINTWAKEGDYVLLTVSDTGKGIPHEIQDRIFEPFFTTKEVGKGTGLGLAAVYGIVRSHQGFIHLYSEPGHGTSFKIYLPATESRSSSADNRKEVAKPVRGGKETVLLAEDEEPVRNMLVHILQKVGYRVFSARDGEEAISLFEKHSYEIDLALLDVIMPGIGGQKVCQHIRAIRPDTPVIFITGYSRGVLDPHAFPDKDYKIIQKPCNPSDLLSKVREVLDARNIV